jgi:hypothetical protein
MSEERFYEALQQSRYLLTWRRQDFYNEGEAEVERPEKYIDLIRGQRPKDYDTQTTCDPRYPARKHCPLTAAYYADTGHEMDAGNSGDLSTAADHFGVRADQEMGGTVFDNLDPGIIWPADHGCEGDGSELQGETLAVRTKILKAVGLA